MVSDTVTSQFLYLSELFLYSFLFRNFCFFCRSFLILLALICFDNSICHLGNDKLYSTDSIIITWDYIIQFLRITVSICNTDQRNT